MKFRMTDNDFDRDASMIEETFFVNFDMGYQYMIVARKDSDSEKMKDNIIYQQLERIRLAMHAIFPNSFKFVTFESSIKTDADILMFACRISHHLLAYKADKLDLVMFNRRKKFLEKFEEAREAEFEGFRDWQVQIIITRLFKDEFDLHLYTTMGLIENSGPIHNLYIKNQLTKTWSLRNAIFSWYIPEGPQGLSKINEINYYLGPNVAYFLAFITLNISWSWVFVIPFLLGSLLHIFEDQLELNSS